MNLARLNHILIPSTHEDRERLRRSRLARVVLPMLWVYGALSEEGRVMLVLMLFVGTAGVEVGATQVYVLWAVLWGVLTGALILRRAYALTGVKVDVSAPMRVAVGEAIGFQLTFQSHAGVDHHAIRVRGPFLPWDGRWEGEAPRIPTLAAGATVRVQMRARFVERGRHHIEPFRACALVPLGLSCGKPIFTAGCRFIVVPALATVVSLELPMGRRYQPGGVPCASHNGEALELAGVRPYRPGDPVKNLHPKTWARTRIPHVREYQQEYFTRVGLIVDNDEEELTENGFEALLSLAAGVVARLANGTALIDLLVLGGDLHPFTVGRALGTIDQALDLLASARPGPGLDNEALISRLEPHLARLSSVLVLTQSTATSRLQLCDALVARQVAARLLRVHDDTGFALLARRRPLLPARGPIERVTLASQIKRQEPIAL
jgi:uncharacterized protein (DUF58 family)